VPLRRLQGLLIATAAGAAIVLSGQFSTAVRAAALVAVLAGVALTYSERFRPGGGWWSLLAAGALLSIAGIALYTVSDDVAGLVSIAGAALVLIGATIGFPAEL
jgi:hypothetical protein